MNNSYLKVIDETLRFVNISFVSFRQATKDVFVNGAIQKPHMFPKFPECSIICA